MIQSSAKTVVYSGGATPPEIILYIKMKFLLCIMTQETSTMK